MNRELRRLQEKEEQRARERRSKGQATRPKRKRVGIRQFLSEVRTELKRVAWPSRRETVTFTVVTLITSAFVTLYAFGMDVVFNKTVLYLLEQIV
ncbi:MAG: preprotein translocase subunit SecE [Actinobacteria bacterium]|nr:preprotein translocase subunit SecE [Actinomycetota bacterium]MBU1494867.1 preprotein translocase subunit SecE [Actinomycetota bacterium]